MTVIEANPTHSPVRDVDTLREIATLYDYQAWSQGGSWDADYWQAHRAEEDRVELEQMCLHIGQTALQAS